MRLPASMFVWKLVQYVVNVLHFSTLTVTFGLSQFSMHPHTLTLMALATPLGAIQGVGSRTLGQEEPGDHGNEWPSHDLLQSRYLLYENTDWDVHCFIMMAASHQTFSRATWDLCSSVSSL